MFFLVFGAVLVLALVDLAWLVSVAVRKRLYTPVEAVCAGVRKGLAVCVRVDDEVAMRGGFGTCSQWLFGFEGQRHIVPKELKGCCDKGKREVGDQGVVYVSPRNVYRSLTPQTDGYFRVFGIVFLVNAASLIAMLLFWHA